jgi:indole-3-glycerol phosphate synthase
MASVLEEIITYKRVEELPRTKRARPVDALRAQAALAPAPRDFRAALAPGRGGWPRLIAEVKRASPSKGVIVRGPFDPVELATTYAANGAAAVSVLTDAKYFQGNLQHLADVRGALAAVPLLRKDFVIDEYQLVEARAAGADAVLLIAGVLSRTELARLLAGARRLRLAPLVEVHDAGEIRQALDAGADLLGVNNRDLHSLAVDLGTTERLRPHIPPGVGVVAESGITSAGDVARLQAAGVDAVLVGEALVRTRPAQRAAAVRALAGQERAS